MTIWILAMLLLGGAAAIGYAQGAIRVGISLIGIVTAALLAGPLAHFIYPIFPPLGVANPFLIWLLSPVVIFALIMMAFKTLAFFVHKKVDVYYKYKAGDLRLSLWNRLNHRLGACLGLVNGTVYLILFVMAVFPMTYVTAQVSAGDQDPATLRWVNKLGRDLQSTGMAKVANAVNPMPAIYFDAVDIVGLVYNNPLLQSRLSRYPTFLALGERPEFASLTGDAQFSEMMLKQVSVAEMLAHPKIKAIVDNSKLQQEIWDLLVPDLPDLKTFLETGKSDKYSEKLLGRWTFDGPGAVLALKRLKPNVTSGYLRQLRAVFYPKLNGATLKACPDKQVFIKNIARMKPGPPIQGARPGQVPPPVIDMLNLTGKWESSGDKYEISADESGKTATLQASFEGDKLLVTGEALPLVFVREE